MQGRAAIISVVAWLLSLATTNAEAGVFAVRMRWQPSTGSAVVGYRVYQRLADGVYGPGLGVGLPVVAPDGTLSAIVVGLDDASAYFFSVTALGPSARESAHSNELFLAGPLAPPPSPDPNGACGTITPVQSLQARRFVLRPNRNPMFAVSGSFPSEAGVDPTVGGATVELRGPGGELLYQLSVPGSAFKSNKRHTSFGFAQSGRFPPPGTAALARLLIRHRGNQVRFALAASAPELVAAAQQTGMSLVIRVDSVCASASSLVCVTAPAHTSCQ